MAHTYIFVADVLEQTGEGFPVNPTWHYEMNPKIAADPRFDGLRTGHLKTLPAVSVSLPVAAIFGPDGIHARP